MYDVRTVQYIAVSVTTYNQQIHAKYEKFSIIRCLCRTYCMCVCRIECNAIYAMKSIHIAKHIYGQSF